MDQPNTSRENRTQINNDQFSETTSFSSRSVAAISWRDNYMGRVASWLARESLPEKIFRFPFTELNIAAQRKISEKFSSYLTYFFRAGGIPQTTINRIRANLILVSFFQGAGLVMDWLWYPTFTGLFLHDFITFFTQIENRYGTRWWQELLGVADNELAISSHLGSDLPTEWQYWVWPGLIAATMSVAGIAQIWRHRAWMKPIQQNMATEDEESFAQRADTPDSITTDSLLEDPLGWYVDRRVFAMTQDGRTDDNDRQILMPWHGGTDDQPGLIGLRGIRALGEIAYSFQPQNLRLLPEEQQKGYSYLGNQALRKLQHIATSSQNKLHYIYVHYQLWTLGQLALKKDIKIIFQPIFWAISAWLFYSKLRLWELWITKIVGFIEYIASLKHCEAENKQYVYLQEFGNYFCTVCGEWPFTYVGNVFDSQRCMDDLLAQERSANFILGYLPQLLKHPDFTEVDLSRQHWHRWTESQWEAFINGLSSVPLQLQTLNLSRPVFNNNFVNDGKVPALAKALEKVSIGQLDLRNQGLGQTLMQPLMKGVRYSNLTYLNLRTTNLDDAGLFIVGNNLPATLAVLNVGDNQITDGGFAQVAGAINNSSVTTLDLADNQLTINSLETFIPLLKNQGLEVLELSGNNFGEGYDHYYSLKNFTDFWQATTLAEGSALKYIGLGNAFIGSSEFASLVPFLSNTTLQYVNFRENNIEDSGITAFFAGLASTNNSLTGMDLSYDNINQDGLSAMAQYLPKTNIIELKFQAAFTVQSFANFTQSLTACKLEHLYMPNTLIGDTAIMSLWQVLPATQLKTIDVSNSDITDVSSGALQKAIAGSRLKNLYLNNNELGDATAEIIAEQLPDSQLEVLSISNAGIGAEGAKALITYASGSSLRELHLDDNFIGDEAMTEFAEKLIRPIPHTNDLSDEKISLDQRRWLKHEAQPATNVTAIYISNTKMGDESARAICRTAYPAKIKWSRFNFNPNVNITEVNVENCRIGQGTSDQSSSEQISSDLQQPIEKAITHAASVGQNRYGLFNTNGSRISDAENDISLPSSTNNSAGRAMLLVNSGVILLIAGSAFFMLLYLVYWACPDKYKSQWYAPRGEKKPDSGEEIFRMMK